MIRHLHPTDSPSLLQFKQRSGPDEVFTLSQALKGGRKSFPLMKYTTIALSPRAWQSCWIESRRTRVNAVLRAGQRSGPHAWELGDLFLNRSNRDVALDVLEQLSFLAGSSGARRIFLRLPDDSDLFDIARAAGYQTAFTQHIYRAESSRDVLGRTDETHEGLALRLIDEEDTHALFRLYCATVPIDSRSRTGQTLDEWTSSQENPGTRTTDWGLVGANGTGLDAHVRSAEVAGARFFSVQCKDDASCRLESLIAAGVGQGGDKAAITIVPSYNRRLAATLGDLGFTRHESYDVMVNMLAVPVKKPAPGMITA